RVSAIRAEIRVEVDVTNSQLFADVTLADGPPVPKRDRQFWVREIVQTILILTIDDRADAVAGDGVAEALGGHLAAAIEDFGSDDAQAFVVGVLGAEVDERDGDEQDRQDDTHEPARDDRHAAPP